MYVGAVLFVFVLPTIAFVDIIGRKKLFYLGLLGMGPTDSPGLLVTNPASNPR
jgi:hypothetical protein